MCKHQHSGVLSSFRKGLLQILHFLLQILDLFCPSHGLATRLICTELVLRSLPASKVLPSAEVDPVVSNLELRQCKIQTMSEEHRACESRASAPLQVWHEA